MNLNVQGSERSRFLTVLLLWSTEVGDSVAVDEIIAQIETDKVCVRLSTCLCSAQIFYIICISKWVTCFNVESWLCAAILGGMWHISQADATMCSIPLIFSFCCEPGHD